MTRACQTCEWSRTEASQRVADLFLSCCESPRRFLVRPDHWCGRWRLGEREIGAAGEEAVAP